MRQSLILGTRGDAVTCWSQRRKKPHVTGSLPVSALLGLGMGMLWWGDWGHRDLDIGGCGYVTNEGLGVFYN